MPFALQLFVDLVELDHDLIRTILKGVQLSTRAVYITNMMKQKYRSLSAFKY